MDNSQSLNIAELDLEPHVKESLLDAQSIARSAPVGRTELLVSVLINADKYNSAAFMKAAELLSEPLRQQLSEASDLPTQRPTKKKSRKRDIVALDADLTRSYQVARQFLDANRVWGRDLVTVALLASGEPFVESDQVFEIGRYLDEWYRFVTTGDHAQHRPWAAWWRAAGVVIPVDSQEAGDDEQEAYLLTWNPDRFDMSKLKEQFDEFRRTGKTRFGWSLGRRKSSSPGDQVLLLKQGKDPRGLVGSGTVVGAAVETDHWDPAEAAKNKKYLQVPIEWGVLSEKPLITKQELDKEFPHSSLWTAQGGGQEIPNDLAHQLSAELFKRLDSKPAQLRERVKTQTDNPAQVDQLGRRPFAEVIAARIDEARKEQPGGSGDEEGAFMVLLHGPWGSGKSSVLNFIRDKLQKDRGDEPKWVIVDFNAWRHQRLAPPWWTVIKQIYSQSREQLEGVSSLVLRVRWAFWRVRADWIPVLVSLLLGGVVLLAAFGVIDTLTNNSVAAAGEGEGGISDGRAKSLELLIKIVTATIAAIAAIAAFSRSLAFGSENAAKTYLEMRDDPLKPIVGLFKKLIDSIPRPVAVFVDDLDRCDDKYVVELLEGVQTLFRSASVTYIVAADRNWICTSFERSYEPFGTSVGDLGRPIGHLFLDKLFQISVAVPQIPLKTANRYWQVLLDLNRDELPGALDKRLKAAEKVAKQAVTDLKFQEEFDAKIAEFEADPIQEQAMRAAAALKITSDEARLATEHRLAKFGEILERNPRAMKRLVNAYGMHQATNILQGRHVDLDALARWTVLQLRWPILADALTENPNLIDPTNSGSPTMSNRIDYKLIVSLLADEEVKRVLSEGAGGSGALTKELIRQIVGGRLVTT